MTPTRRLSVLAIVQYGYDTQPAQRYRIEQWEPLLRRDHGIDITWSPFLAGDAYRVFMRRGNVWKKAAGVVAGMARRVGDVAGAGRYDVVYILREAAAVGPAVFERLFAARVPYIYDFDDAIFLPQVSEANRAFALLKSHRKFGPICRLASCVTAGNEYLAAHARRHNPHVEVIPTTVDTDRYLPRQRPENPVPVIGWTGSSTTATYVRDLQPVFQRLAETHRFRLRIIGAPEFEPAAGVDTELVTWSAAGEIDELSRIDIGIMPLRDDEWARGKCGLKALLHMAMAQPVVCSPVGVNTQIVTHGRNGFFAATPDEWVSRLRELLDSADLRQRLGSAARSTVEERYSARVHVPRLARVLHEAAAARG